MAKLNTTIHVTDNLGANHVFTAERKFKRENGEEVEYFESEELPKWAEDKLKETGLPGIWADEPGKSKDKPEDEKKSSK